MKKLSLKWYSLPLRAIKCLKDISGVYVFVFVKSNVIRKILYAGQSECLHTRLTQHLSESHNVDLRKCIDIYGDYITVKVAAVSPKQLDGVELYLYKRLHPIFNDKTPPGKNQIICDIPPSIEKWLKDKVLV